jgi:hypothetical protein
MTKNYALVAGTAIVLMLSFTGTAFANNDPKHQFLAGTGVFCSFGATLCPDVASAANGDTLTLSGSGTFIANPSGQASGGGTFVHRDSSGNIKGFGTWSAEQLVSFSPGGFTTLGGALPKGSQGGQAVLLVHISPATGGPGFTGILTISCHLASSFPEGFTLDIPGLIDFNTMVSGGTLFIQE